MAFRDTINRHDILARFPRLMRYGLQESSFVSEAAEAVMGEVGVHDTRLADAIGQMKAQRTRQSHWHEEDDLGAPSAASRQLAKIVSGIDALRSAGGDDRGRALGDALLMLYGDPNDRDVCARLAAAVRVELDGFSTNGVVRVLAARAGLPEIDWRALETLAARPSESEDEEVPIEIDFDAALARIELAGDPIVATARLILDWIAATEQLSVRARTLLGGLSAMATGHRCWVGNRNIAECALAVGEEVLSPLREAAMSEANAAVQDLVARQRRTWERKAVDSAIAALGASSTLSQPVVETSARGGVRICAAPAKMDGKIKEMIRPYEHVIGRLVPLAPTLDLSRARAVLLAEFPHCEHPVDQVLRDLVGKEYFRLTPMLIVGAPGVGKSRFVRRLGEVLDIGVFRVDGSGDAGASFGGTERRWYSTEPSRPFMACSRFRIANPLMLVDEIDKAPVRSDYGRLWDSMLQFLEPETAARFMDPCLQVEMDLSHVSIVATANSVQRLPGPLLDRFAAIVEMPAPGREHIVPLSRHLAADIARARGWDERFVTPFDETELAVMSRAWRGGSVRRLRRIAETVVRGRERAERDLLQ